MRERRLMKTPTRLRIVRIMVTPGALGLFCGFAIGQPNGAPQNWRIESDRQGPFRLGMPKATVVRTATKHGLKAVSRTVEAEGEKYPEILLSRGRDSLARFELERRCLAGYGHP